MKKSRLEEKEETRKKLGKKEYSLTELVKGITPQNRHTEVDFGYPVGKELI